MALAISRQAPDRETVGACRRRFGYRPLEASYSPWLVATSIVIAIVDSYVSFSVTGRLARSRGTAAAVWLILGALAMGFGVWAMHFVGMLAFHIGTPLGYEPALTAASVLPIVAASGAVLWQVARRRMTGLRLCIAGAVLGGGIGAMHYTGMAAMRILPAIIWIDWRVAASVLFAIAGSTAALWFGVKVSLERGHGRRVALRWVASIVMGCSVAGMHYLGMSAAMFADGAICLSASSVLRGTWLGIVVTVVSICVLLGTLAVATYHHRVQRRERHMDAALGRAHSALAFHAFHDVLTGLPNRTHLMDTLRTICATAQRPVAVLFIDLNGFKAINDSLGHEAGDQFLRVVAHTLRSSVREQDMVARCGGDEFVIVLDGFGNLASLAGICETILDLMSGPVAINGHAITVSPSIGVAISPGDGDDAETLVRNADTAMYSVKELGKAGFRFFEHSMRIMASERLTLTQQLRAALQDGTIDVHYQPQWKLGDGSLVGLEALARWQHPTRGAIGPSIFVPLAERSGMVALLGAHVLRRVLQQILDWDAVGFDPGHVSINLSLHELRDPGFADAVRETVMASTVDPSRIRFEITESTSMDGTELTLGQLRQLRRHGFALSVDDFGTGYSSLSHLRQLPTQTIKIDQTFVRGDSAEDRDITEAIIALAKKLRLETVAEGVESEAQMDWLRAVGCDFAQGFFLSRPMPADELLQHLIALDSPSVRLRTRA